MLIDINPARNLTLTKITTVMIKLSKLYWLIFKGSPLRIVESVIEIDVGNTNKVITKQIVVIEGLYFKRRSTREVTLKSVMKIELGISLV